MGQAFASMNCDDSITARASRISKTAIAIAPQSSQRHCCRSFSHRPHGDQGYGNTSRSYFATSLPTQNARPPQIELTSMHDIIEIHSNVLQPAATAWRDALPHVLHRDYETRSRAFLKTVGTYKYATDPSTEVLCCAYAVDDEPVQLWMPGNPVPAEFIEAATNPSWIVCAHGAHFEDAIERHILHPRFGWLVFPV